MTTKEIYPLRSTETMSILSDRDLKISTQLIAKLGFLLSDFDANNKKPTWDPIPLLKEISKMLERATEKFYKNDPDPMDDRHPHRTHPDSLLGNILKVIFKNDDFMTKLVVSYVLARDNVELSIQGCRVLLACVPGLDPIVVFSEPDDFIPRLYQYAGPQGTNETLAGYAMCLLAAALDNTENASKYRNENAELVPYALNKLRELQARSAEEHKANSGPTDFSSLNPSTSKVKFEIPSIQVTSSEDDRKENENGIEQEPTTSTSTTELVPFSEEAPPPKKRRTEPCLSKLHRAAETAKRVPSFHNLKNLDDSNSRWDILQPFLIGTEQVYPLSLASYQRFILQFLAACGEYQDLLPQVYEGNALELLLDYIDLEKSKDVRLTFDALRYLTSLLVHRKVALEFIERGGITAILRLPRASLASCAVVTCFYYIAYNNDAVELLCQMSDEVVDEAVEYILWCFEHNHESGKSSACMFFAQTLDFKAILTRFDRFDGPRMLYNYVSTLNLMQFRDVEIDLTEEQVHTSTQVIRAFCSTIKSYLLAHFFVKMENYKKQYDKSLPCGLKFPEAMQPEYSVSKSMKDYQELSLEFETIVLEMLRYTGHTFPEIQNLWMLGMVKILLGVRVFSRDWISISAGIRNEMCTNAFDSLRMLLCQPSIQTELIPTHRFFQAEYDGLTILFQTALGRSDEETQLRIAALSCIQRCVCVEPDCWKTIMLKMKTEQRQSITKKTSISKYEKMMNHLETMWTEVRKTDGIMSLIALINSKTPLTEADSIRKLATITLTGLAKHPEVRQILAKLPLIAQSGLQILMRDPVCSDKREIHAAFCKEAVQLLQLVHGRKIHDQQAKELQSSEKSHRQWVVENTTVSFNQVELLQLIHDHLVKSNLDSVAAMLKTQAKLPDKPASMTSSSSIMNKPLPSTGSNFTRLNDTYPTLAPRILESEIGGISARRPSQATQPPGLSSPITRSRSEDDATFATPTLPRRYTNSGMFPKKLMISPAKSKQRPATPGDARPLMDLSSIVTNYFRTQHANCINPVTTCPPFSLFYPHKCPERVQKTNVMKNISHRIISQELSRPHQRIVTGWSNERYIFSKFKSVKTIHDNEESYTRAIYSVDDEHLIVGHFNGELHWINADTGADESHTNCHGSALTNIDASKDGSMILTSCAYSRPLSALWRLGQNMQRAYTYREDTCVRFANTSIGKIIGTNKEKVTVYDTETNHVLDTYMIGTHGLDYDKNYASFSPDDKLIFSDGLLWDVRNRNAPIHTFDRLASKTKFGTFHPHGNQIIINSDVYDIRTFRMLHHVPELNQCKLIFNSSGNIMIATETSNLHRPDYPDMIYSSLRSFDTLDYSVLTTVEGRRPTIDITLSHQDQKLCLIEQTRPIMSDYMIQSSTQLRILEPGRLKEAEEEEGEDDEEETREDQHTGEDSDETGDEDENDDNANEQESVFDALGRLEDASDSDHSIDEDDDDDDSSLGDFDFEAALNRIIRRQALRRRQRANQHAGIDGDDEGEEDLLGDLDEDDIDPDFDMDEAIDDLVDAVDEEINDEELDDEEAEEGDDDDDSGSWRTASQVGSEDINLDELEEEEARQMENEEEEEAPEAPQAPEPPVVQADPVEAARRAYLARGLRGFQLGPRGRGIRRRHRQNMNLEEMLEARAVEQRAQFMEAIAREGEAPNDNIQPPVAHANSDDEFQSEEEEINSVSTTALNPAMRRRNRRLQEDDDENV